MPIGYAVAGPVADAIGVDTTLAIAAAFGIVPHLAILSVPSVRRLRRIDVVEGDPALPATAG